MAQTTPGPAHAELAAPEPQVAAGAFLPTGPEFLTQLQHAAGNRATSLVLAPPDSDLVNRAVQSPGASLDTAVRLRMEAWLSQSGGRWSTQVKSGSKLSVVAPWHQVEREAELPSPQRKGWTGAVDLSDVRIHRGAPADDAARALGARAFTLGSDIVVRNSESLSTGDGLALVAHELIHTQQQKAGSRAIMRKPAADVADVPTSRASDPANQSVGFAAFSHRERALSRQVVALSHAYRHLVGAVYPYLNRARVLTRKRLDYDLYWHGVLGVYAVEDDIVDKDAYDPVQLSRWIQVMQGGLEDLRKLISVLKESDEREADRLDADAAELETQRQALAGQRYIVTGFEAREKEAATADLNRRLDEAKSYMDAKLAEIAGSPNREQLTRWYGEIFAQKLVDQWRLNGPQIRSLLERYRAEGRLNEALMGGSLVQTLLTRGVGGFYEYRAPGEGLLAGATRTELELKITHPVQERHFVGWENLIVVGGFVAGLFQGIGDDLIDNLKMIYQLFTPTLWKQIYTFLTDELPHLAADEEYRFEVGSVLGRGELDEQRRIAGADPFEYGRTIGHASGVVLTEIVLLFIGIGWVLKAAKASPTIMKIVKPVMRIINAIAKTAAGKKIAEFAVWAAKGLAVIERRFQLILLKIPALTEAGRTEKLIKEAQLATERLKSLQVAARRASLAGDEEHLAKYMEEFQQASNELDTKLGLLEEKTGAPAVKEGTGAAAHVQKPEVKAATPGDEPVATPPKEETPVTSSTNQPPAAQGQTPAPQTATPPSQPPAPAVAVTATDWASLEARAELPQARQATGGFRAQRARAGNREVVVLEGRVGEQVPQSETLAKYVETLPGEHATHGGGMQIGENLPEVISSAPAKELNLGPLKRVENTTREVYDRAVELGGSVEIRTRVQIEHRVVAGEDVPVLVGVKREAWVRPPGSDEPFQFIDFEATIDPVTRNVTIVPGGKRIRPVK